MNRLQAELQRLYLPAGAQPPEQGVASSHFLADAEGRTRVLLLELGRPADWSALSAVWRAVQAELDLPAPAIAVNGQDACQLWFSLAEAVPQAQGRRFLEGLRAAYLKDVAAPRVVMLPAAAAAPGGAAAPVLPPVQVGPERWSAFIAPDLAPLFSAEPWIDQPPGADAQADVLARLASTGADAFQRACEQLARSLVPAAPGRLPVLLPGAPVSEAQPPASAAQLRLDPQSFLYQVMQDPTVDLRLRVEAAKALLPYAGKAG